MNRFPSISLAAIGAAALPHGAMSQGDPERAPWHMMHDWGGGWGMILGPLYMIAWVAILVAVILFMIRWMGVGSPGTNATPRTARDILDERFARGEIDQDEYEKRRRALNT